MVRTDELGGVEGLRHDVAMLLFRINVLAELSDPVVRLLQDEPGVSSVSLARGASLAPRGDLVLADVAREKANVVVDGLRALGVHKQGVIHITQAQTWISQPARDAEAAIPGASADAVVWADVTQRAYEDSELNWTYLTFMTLATLIASIAIVLDSQILVIGAMVLGPEFGVIAALGLALVRRRRMLFTFAMRTLVLGFAVGIGVTTLAALLARALGWVTYADVVGPRPFTEFVYRPDKWSFIVALIAAAAGVLSLTSGRVGGLSGVFISVTTVPAAGNVALGLAFGAGSEVWGSTMQLLLNISGMVLAGWGTLALQQWLWSRGPLRHRRVGLPAEA